jgi:predicted dehydrogenase
MDIGVIGVGVMGKNHARVYSELKSVDSLFIYDIDKKSAQAVSDQYGATSVSLENLLETVDAVSVCVPTQYHTDIVKQVFAAERSVLIEKPICATFKEAKELVQLVPVDSVVGVGHIERFNPVISEIQKIIKNPLYVELKRHNPASARVTGSSVIEDLMIHDIDILINIFFSTPKRIDAVGNNDVCNVIMECGKIPVNVSASRKSSKKIRKIYIEEEDFTIEGDFMSQEVIIYHKPGRYQFESDRYAQENVIEKVMVNKLEPLKVELSTFIECVKNNVPFPITPHQAMMDLYVCEWIHRALYRVD